MTQPLSQDVINAVEQFARAHQDVGECVRSLESSRGALGAAFDARTALLVAIQAELAGARSAGRAEMEATLQAAYWGTEPDVKP